MEKEDVLIKARKNFKKDQKLFKLIEKKPFLYNLAVETYSKLLKKKSIKEIYSMTFQEFLNLIKNFSANCNRDEIRVSYLIFETISSMEIEKTNSKHDKLIAKKIAEAIRGKEKEIRERFNVSKKID